MGSEPGQCPPAQLHLRPRFRPHHSAGCCRVRWECYRRRMPFHRRVVPVAPDPLELARALRGHDARALLWSATGRGPSWVTCDPDAWSGSISPEGASPECPPQLLDVPRWIGIIPYEALRTIERNHGAPDCAMRATPHHTEIQWARYRAVARIGTIVEVLGDDQDAVERLARALLGASVPARAATLRLIESIGEDEKHQERIERALRLIERGELYVINLARRFECVVDGDPIDILEILGKRAPAPYAAALDWPNASMVSTSPELMLQTDSARNIVTRPIKGTRPRGHDPLDDRRIINALDADPKERAELAMVTDVERNDLGRIAVPGSVLVEELGRVETHGPVHHRVATVRARIGSDVSAEALLRAMLPSGSVTGAPKLRAMEAIAELEADRRGLYTGAHGFATHGGLLTLAMSIRCLTMRDGDGHYHAGGGIVADSDPAREVQETHWKAAQLGARR